MKASNLSGEGSPSAEVSAVPKAPSDLIVSSLTVPATGGSGLAIAISESTRNQGTGPSLATTTRFYLSKNSLWDAGDTAIGHHDVPALAAGAQSDASLSLDLPAGLSPGYWYVVARADANGVETETQEANNTTARLMTLGPDLTVTVLTVPSSAGAGTTMPATTTVKNLGGGAAGTSAVRFFLSVNAVWDGSDTPLVGRVDVPALAPAASATGVTTVTLPAGLAARSYYLVALADGDGSVVETQEANNGAARLLQIGGDLVVSALTAPAKAPAGGGVMVTDTVRNTGAGAIGASVTRFYLSSNAVLEAGDALLAAGRSVPALAPGATSTGSATVVLPAGLAAGTWYVIAKADGDGLVSETLETNNTLARSVSVGPDLVVSTMSVPYTVHAGATITVADTVANQGADPAGPSATRFYLSSNVTLDPADVPLDRARLVASLAAGAASAGTTTITIPAGTTAGAWFVIARTDASEAVLESVEGNNTAARAVQVSP